MKPKPHRLLMCAGSVALAIGLLTLALGIVQGAGSLTRITTFTGTATERRSEFPDLSADGAVRWSSVRRKRERMEVEALDIIFDTKFVVTID